MSRWNPPPTDGCPVLLRRLLIATTVLALGLTPVAAFAQEGEAEPTPEVESTPLEQLSEAVVDWAEALLLGRESVEDVEGEDEEATAEFDALVDSLEVVLADVFATLHFSQVEAEALEEAEELEEGDEEESAHGEAVSTVAQCAPRGSFGGLVEGMRNHGEYVTAAAHGETVDLVVPTIADGPDGPVVEAPVEDGEPTSFDLATVEGATALCDALDVIYQARLLQLEVAWEDVDAARDARVIAREQCRLERLRTDVDADEAKEACAELRARVREQHEADRAERAEERDAAKAARAEEREARRAEKDAEREERRAARDEAKAERGRPDRG